MVDRIRFLDKLNPGTKKRILRALDYITRPLTRDELDEALKPYLLKSQRRATVEALANLDIIAIVYRRDDAPGD
ncbi:hypothetical protein [Croceicoccus marinus]|uniref:Uncharacterized protein n=1 Tax=Croceicoccus marinus TaxID=450378 RepID=A0A7G6VUK2_9SPHN|nr:hypothetical protein [Croceicoccus marinus]QNE05417.1 hypothetical protein H4O24_01525 [Croceicoccus marinus]